MDASQSEVKRQNVKHVFLDVVRFSKRSVEAQFDIIYNLNDIVRKSLEFCHINERERILIPTGDGMCVTLLKHELPYDIHLQTALKILALLHTHNESEADESRQFQVRIGINEGYDIIIDDINQRRNIAGSSINMTARIMDKADGNQILVSDKVYKELDASEKYRGSFRLFQARDKHGNIFNVYQYISANNCILNCKIPNEFIEEKIKLDNLVAYYIAHLIKEREFIKNKLFSIDPESAFSQFSLMIIFWSLSDDSKARSEATETYPYRPRIYGEGKLTFDELFSYYRKLDIHTTRTLTNFIASRLEIYHECFEKYIYGLSDLLVSDYGKQKLKIEFPEIWIEFNLDSFT
jgi:class 3 adenylate cyclase